MRPRSKRASAGPPRSPKGEWRKESRLTIWVLGLGLLVAGTLGAYVLGRVSADTLLAPARMGGPSTERAPDLIGRTLEDARRAAEEKAGGLDVLGLAYAADRDSGEVLFQYPTPGLPLEAGKPIEVIVSGGAGHRRVPDLAGLPDSAALSLLTRAGVTRTPRVEVAEPGTEKGTVVSTDPPAGSPLEGVDSVTLQISRGGDIIEVPSLIGKTAQEAAEILKGAQLAVGKTSFAGEEQSPGELVVVGQEPPAGGLAASGSAVDLRLGEPRPEPAE